MKYEQRLQPDMTDSKGIGDRYGFRKIIDQKDVAMRMALKSHVYDVVMERSVWKDRITSAVEGGRTSCDVEVHLLEYDLPDGVNINFYHYDEDGDPIRNDQIVELVKSHVSDALAGAKINLVSTWIITDDDGDDSWWFKIKW